MPSEFEPLLCNTYFAGEGLRRIIKYGIGGLRAEWKDATPHSGTIDTVTKVLISEKILIHFSYLK